VLLRSIKLGTDFSVHRFFLDNEHPTLEDVQRVWAAVLKASTQVLLDPIDPGDYQLACSITELQALTEQSGKRAVAATSKCVRYLHEWGFLQRSRSITTVSMYGDEDYRAKLQEALGSSQLAAGRELPLPAGLRAGTQQAKAWRFPRRHRDLQCRCCRCQLLQWRQTEAVPLWRLGRSSPAPSGPT
jgi:hypothetical protein